MHLSREDVGRDGDDPHAPQGADGHRLVIVAGPDVEVLQAQVPGPLDVPQVSGGLLGADDVGVLPQLGIGLRRDGNPSAGGHIVENAGEGDRVGNGLVVADQTRLCRFVVVGRHQQQSIGPGLFRLPGESDGHRRGVGAGSGDYRHPALYMVHTERDDLRPLLRRHGAGLPGGAAGHDGVRAALKLEIQQLSKGIKVNAVFCEGCGDGHAGACKNRFFQENTPFFNRAWRNGGMGTAERRRFSN